MAVLRSKKLLEQMPVLPDKSRHFLAVQMQLAVFALLSIGAAWAEDVPLVPRQAPSLRGVLLGVILLGLALLVMRHRWRENVRERQRILWLFMPTTESQRRQWVVISILAGCSEEITWRGVQLILLQRLTGNLWMAIVICSVMFAVAHVIQGWTSVAAILLFAFGFHAIVLLTGSLLVAVITHAIYDLVAGFTYARFARELGYDTPV